MKKNKTNFCLTALIIILLCIFISCESKGYLILNIIPRNSNIKIYDKEGYLYTSENNKEIILESGEYDIIINAENFQQLEEKVNIEKNKKTLLNKELKLLKRSVLISSFPIGASVYLNDKLIGETPVNQEIEVGEYRSKIYQDEHNYIEEPIKVEYHVPFEELYLLNTTLEMDNTPYYRLYKKSVDGQQQNYIFEFNKRGHIIAEYGNDINDKNYDYIPIYEDSTLKYIKKIHYNSENKELHAFQLLSYENGNLIKILNYRYPARRKNIDANNKVNNFENSNPDAFIDEISISYKDEEIYLEKSSWGVTFGLFVNIRCIKQNNKISLIQEYYEVSLTNTIHLTLHNLNYFNDMISDETKIRYVVPDNYYDQRNIRNTLHSYGNLKEDEAVIKATKFNMIFNITIEPESKYQYTYQFESINNKIISEDEKKMISENLLFILSHQHILL